MAEQPVVELKGISKHFGEGAARVDALREVSFDVFPGTVIGLRGPSGSGKSTVLNVIGCILEPNSGSMRLNGELVYDGKWLRADLREPAAGEDRLHLPVAQSAAVSQCLGECRGRPHSGRREPGAGEERARSSC